MNVRILFRVIATPVLKGELNERHANHFFGKRPYNGYQTHVVAHDALDAIEQAKAPLAAMFKRTTEQLRPLPELASWSFVSVVPREVVDG